MESLYEKYGGDSFWESVLNEFYEKNLNDLILKSFFEGKDVEKIKRMNKHLLASALRASDEFVNVDVKKVHCNYGIGLEHFNRFLLNFYNVLTSFNISEEDVEYMLVVIDSFKDDVVT